LFWLTELLRRVKAFETAEGEGAIVKLVFPTRYLRSYDPFPLLDEFNIEPPAGFPDHPHGGYEAITYMLEGGFHHRDNLGNDSIVMAGGAQRFMAGKPLIHSELPGTDGVNRGLQLWVRLPSKLQGLAPTYQQVDAKSIPEKRVNGHLFRTVVGETSSVKLQNEVVYLDVTLEPNRIFTCEVRRDFNAFIYVLEGTAKIGDTEVEKGEAALLKEGDSVALSAAELARLVIIGGKPHGEENVLRGSSVY
jgi:redox-sensitive bicupin YhaK (pirin superfamily)